MYCEATCTEVEIDRLVSDLLDALPGAELAERHGRFLRLDAPSLSSLGLGMTFRRLEALKETEGVENYSISQCSLEQVFLKLANSGNSQETAGTPTENGGDETSAIRDEDPLHPTNN